MTTAENKITTIARDLLKNNLPFGIPSGIVIRAESDKEVVAKPVFIFTTSEAEYLHPRLLRFSFHLVLQTRADFTDAEVSAAWHQSACETISSLILSLRAQLALAGFGMLRFIPASLSDAENPAEDRHRILTQSWKVHLTSP